MADEEPKEEPYMDQPMAEESDDTEEVVKVTTAGSMDKKDQKYHFLWRFHGSRELAQRKLQAS